MAQVASSIVRVERLESLASECCVQESQRPRSFWPFVNRIALVHERATDATERVGWCSGVELGFSQDFVKDAGHPIPSRRTVMAVISIAIPEELREVTAASILEEGLPGIKISADHVRDLREGVLFKLHWLYQSPRCTGPDDA